MKLIDTSEWKEFVVEDLFDIHPTKAYKLTNSALMSEDGKNHIVVNSSYNNGVGGYTNKETTETGGIITFSDTTTAESIFFQREAFVGYPHVQGMYPKKYKNQWSEWSLLFFVVVFKARAIGLNYDYVNKFTRASANKIKIKLPVDGTGNPNFAYMEAYMQNLSVTVSDSLRALRSAKNSVNYKKLDTTKFKDFHLYDIFEIDAGTKLDKAKMDTSVGEVCFVGRSSANNGITQKVRRIKDIDPYNPGCITLALGGAYLGSCFIQSEPFYTSQNVVVLTPLDNISFEAKQFIATAIFKESQNNYRAFIKELNAHIKRDFSIKLPVKTDGTPDYEFMERYMIRIADATKNSIEKFAWVVN